MHIIKTPSGKFGVVGRVPLCLMQAREPTREDVMAGRVLDGVGYVGKGFASVEEILEVAEANAVEMCSSSTCACRKLF